MSSASSVNEQNNMFLTMWDTGGQPVFQDLLPCFARLNCIYGIVFRLTDIKNFDSEKPEIRPCDQYHHATTSPFTTKDIFYRNLAFVKAFSCSMLEKVEDLPMFVRASVSSSDLTSPASIVVGTCKDEVRNSDSDLQLQAKKTELYEEMKEFIHDLNLLDSQDDFNVIEIDNTVSGKKLDPGIDQLRRKIHLHAKDSKLKIKPEWQKFRLSLQRACYRQDQYLNQAIMPLHEAIAIGEECGVTKPESVLMYFHELGIIMWYHLSKRRSMNNYVVINQKILLDVLSKNILL